MVQKEPIIIRKTIGLFSKLLRLKYSEFKYSMRKTNPQAFVSVQKTSISGRFVERISK